MASLIFSLISGLLVGLSFNLPEFSFLVWVSLVPFFYAIVKGNRKISILLGIIFALSYYGLVLFWIANVTKLGLAFLLFYLSFYGITFAFLGRYFLNRPLRMITLPCLWVILEFFKEIIWCGFGWANLGYAQYQNFHLIQIADLGGMKLISFLIVMVNVLILEIVFALKQGDRNYSLRRNIFKKGFFVFLIFLVCFSYSSYRLKDLKESDSLEVSIVQPNIPQGLKWESLSQFKIIDTLSNLAGQTREDSLVIFPEASWPAIIDQSNFYQLEQFIWGINRVAIIGAVEKQKGKFYNVALLFDKKTKLIDTYRKIKLVPFGEYVPLRRFLTFIEVLNSIGDTSRGEKFVKFNFNNRSFSVLICFEDIFPRHVAKFARDNDFLVNITNDAWFKGEPEASQHLAIMTLRAIENRISIIRSANTGISGWVSFRGEIKKLTKADKEVFFASAKGFQVSLNRGRSFYNRYGEFFPLFCTLFLLVFLCFIRDRSH